MSNRQLPPTADAFAYWREGKVHLALHGLTPSDDRATTLSPAQALKLAVSLIQSVREANSD